jgi:predicted RNA polymerase sigma factor
VWTGDESYAFHLERALKSHRFGSYALQAAIAAVHAEAESPAATDWRQIVALYNQLVRIQPSPVVYLNRAVAIAMRDGPEAGLAHIDAVLEHGELATTTWRIQPVQISIAGSAGQLRLGPLMRKLWR